jgi:hypothetical protein
MSQISDILKIFPLKSRTYENGYKNYSANCFCKFKGLQLTFQVVWIFHKQIVLENHHGPLTRLSAEGLPLFLSLFIVSSGGAGAWVLSLGWSWRGGG